MCSNMTVTWSMYIVAKRFGFAIASVNGLRRTIASTHAGWSIVKEEMGIIIIVISDVFLNAKFVTLHEHG